MLRYLYGSCRDKNLPFREFQPEKRLPKILGDLLRLNDPFKMDNYTIFKMFENPRIGKQARNFTTNVPKILDLKSSSAIFSEN